MFGVGVSGCCLLACLLIGCGLGVDLFIVAIYTVVVMLVVFGCCCVSELLAVEGRVLCSFVVWLLGFIGGMLRLLFLVIWILIDCVWGKAMWVVACCFGCLPCLWRVYCGDLFGAGGVVC